MVGRERGQKDKAFEKKKKRKTGQRGGGVGGTMAEKQQELDVKLEMCSQTVPESKAESQHY